MQAPNPLFRKEAIDGQKKTLLGEAIILPKTNHTLLTGFLLLWFMLLFILLLNGKFTNKATVKGWLVSSKPSIDIFSKEAGSTLSSMQIINGQSVLKGQTLGTLIRNQTSLVDGAIKQEQFESLNQQLKLLKNRQIILTQKYAQMGVMNNELNKNYYKKRTASQQQDKKLTSQLKEALMQERRLNSLLAGKSITKSVYNSQKEKRRSVELSLSKHRSARLDIDQAMSATLQNKVSNKIEFNEQINLLHNRYEDIQQQLANFKGTLSYQLKSPINGIVHNLQVVSGETLSTATPLMQITPNKNPLKAVFYVPSNHSGFIQRRQSVELKLAAFPFQKFGMSSAEISYVSQKSLLPSQLNKAPFAFPQPVFMIEANLMKQTIEANGKVIQLKAGMLFQADIKLSERSLWEWLLKPIYSLRGQA